jgi:poly(hydroxyalkanoate) depolymerase family esterase
MIRMVCLGLLVVALAGVAPAAGTFERGVRDGRAYRVWVPARVEPARPLVVALHGCWQTPEDFALGTRLNAAADARGLVVVYPAQSQRANPYRCWNWFDPEHQAATRGEPAEILAIARHVQAERGVKEPRMIVLGFSAGAWMAVNLACAAPEAVWGIGSAAGGPYRCADGTETAIQCMRGVPRDASGSCGAGRSPGLRASLWQGGLDTVVSPANLTSLETLFGRVLGVSAGATSKDGGAIHAVYRDRHGLPVLETWLVPAMGHAWSGGDARASHTWPPGPTTTDRMLDFLLRTDAP